LGNSSGCWCSIWVRYCRYCAGSSTYARYCASLVNGQQICLVHRQATMSLLDFPLLRYGDDAEEILLRATKLCDDDWLRRGNANVVGPQGHWKRSHAGRVILRWLHLRLALHHTGWYNVKRSYHHEYNHRRARCDSRKRTDPSETNHPGHSCRERLAENIRHVCQSGCATTLASAPL
jgi:hypothetical protein